MAEFAIFMSETDLENVVTSLLAAGCVLLPDELYEQPKAHEIASLQEFRFWRCERKKALFFAVSAAWSVAPIELDEVEKQGRRVYFIMQKTGGPTLDIFAPLSFRTKDGREALSAGFIAYHASFWNTLTNQAEKAPDALKAMYKRLTKELRYNADLKKSKTQNYIVATGAKELFAAGVLIGHPFLD